MSLYYEPDEDDVAALRDMAVFPVRAPNGDVNLCSRSSDFVILDHQEYATYFTGKIKTLDFTPDRFREIRAFVEACKLQKRYISNTVVEDTNAFESVENATLSKVLQSKAFALYRYAIQ